MSKQLVFSGQRHYAIRKLAELKRQGYVLVRTREWSDGSATYVMEMKNV
jgi:hypothetical protein